MAAVTVDIFRFGYSHPYFQFTGTLYGEDYPLLNALWSFLNALHFTDVSYGLDPAAAGLAVGGIGFVFAFFLLVGQVAADLLD